MIYIYLEDLLFCFINLRHPSHLGAWRTSFLYFDCLMYTYGKSSNKRPSAFKRLPPINTPPKIRKSLWTPPSFKRPLLIYHILIKKYRATFCWRRKYYYYYYYCYYYYCCCCCCYYYKSVLNIPKLVITS